MENEVPTSKRGGRRFKRFPGRGGVRPAHVVSRRKRLTRRKQHTTPQPVYPTKNNDCKVEGETTAGHSETNPGPPVMSTESMHDLGDNDCEMGSEIPEYEKAAYLSADSSNSNNLLEVKPDVVALSGGFHETSVGTLIGPLNISSGTLYVDINRSAHTLEFSPQSGSSTSVFIHQVEGQSVQSATLMQSGLSANVSSQKSPAVKPFPEASYRNTPCDPLAFVQDSLQCQNDPIAAPYSLLKEVTDKFELFLFHRWHAIIHLDAIHVVLFSAQNKVSVQRSIEFSSNGDVKLFVHCQPVDIEPYIHNATDPVSLSYASVDDFVHRMTKIVDNVRQMEVCSGIDSKDLKAGWQSCPLGKIDQNPYKEGRYSETFRSYSCLGLVKRNAWRCSECTQVVPHLTRRAHCASKEPHPNTPNVYLTEEIL